ncbi:M20 family metallopeptidase [Candidatus Nanohalovita haloferacivicina]|uniref:M20 family metallopeptidase n=1 Tax=Candidatus Nanohalovita haloferacivicina TaxID=2978046 RepID=UPI00325FC9BA|nr:Succinyl-diaminopimelate desuccinylase [Candidatus Nanohalobia archaeon BNXNv]
MADRQDEILELTKDLVSFKSTNDNLEEINNCLNFIEDYFSGPEFEVFRHESEGIPSMVVTFGEENPDLMLHGHIDVIEAPDEMFETNIEDGKLYGRGTGDMKAGVAALMQVMKDLKDEKPSVGLMIVSDEEVGGFNGAGHLFGEHYSPEFAVSAEPNNIEGYLDIIADQKGILQLKVSTEGLSAHGSRPWNGENAAESFMEKWPEIKNLFEDHQDGEKWVTTVNLGKVRAGESTNKVPEKAEAWLDIRTAREYPNEEVIEDIRGIEGLSVDQVNLDESMLSTAHDNKFIQALKSSAEGFEDECRVSRKEPGSDMRYLTENGIPAVVFGPEGYNAHSPDEYAVIDSFGDYYSIMMDFVRKNFS